MERKNRNKNKMPLRNVRQVKETHKTLVFLRNGYFKETETLL